MKCSVPNGVNTSAHIGWCPGCGHGIIARLVAEAAQALGIEDRIIMVEDVACGEFAQNVLQFNSIGAAHGRPIITAAGAKRVRPDAIVIAHPGDGSAYSIGMESTIHCALRNENILALVVNNSVFGMTGGQMAPTTLPGQKTATSPKGKDAARYGTLSAVELLKGMDIAYLARGELVGAPGMNKCKALIKQALQHQLNGDGFSLVELLSPCPTNLNLPPVEARDYVHNEMTKYYPLGEFINKGGNN